jgi:2-keto-3-deoxy-L-rhamnonate aldolase RhmA
MAGGETEGFRNPARERMAAGGIAIGIGLRQARTVDIATAMATAGLDWLFVDLEHGAMGLDMAVQISVAANAAGISPLVRVPKGQYDMATRALDGGAAGIVMPHVDSAAEAREMVDRLKFPPEGHRSVGGPAPQLAFAALALAEATAAVNKGLLLTAMIESPQAVAEAEAIAAVPGVDVLLIGTNDLTLEMGIPGQLMHADIVKAYERVIAACRKHGKWPAMGGVYSDDGIARYVGLGMRMVLAGSDLSFVMAGAGARARSIRALG